MMNIDATIYAGRRAAYLFDTKPAARALGIDPNKFASWWYRTRRFLLDLRKDQPHELAAAFALLLLQPPPARLVSPILTRRAAIALNMDVAKFEDWRERTFRKLASLAETQPRPLAVELLAILATD